jgi:glutathione S-transferase
LLVHEHFVNPVVKGIPTDPAGVARAEEMFHAAAAVLNDQLAGKEWVTQDKLTLVDYAIGAEFALAGPAKFPMTKYTNIQAWFARIQELPAWNETNPPKPA